MTTRYIEIYSGNRNRLMYPNPASFEVPFAAVQPLVSPATSVDPVTDGAISFYFTLNSRDYPFMNAKYIDGSRTSATLQFDYYDPGNIIPNFYNGYILLDTTTKQQHIIRSFDPSSGSVTFDLPFDTALVAGNTCEIYAGYPDKYGIFLPLIDNSGNKLNRTAQYYNGYYVVFESPNDNYSNLYNSNIFYRQISYYDNVNQIAYFDKPLPFNYPDDGTNQLFTLRKSLPSERWTLDKSSYFNKVPPANPQIGPDIGWVIVLPDGASSVDNYYTGKFIYAVSNAPEVYNPPLPPRSQLAQPLTDIFYPIYGLFYINAYNGATKECSILKINTNEYNESTVPTYEDLTQYSSASFYLEPEVSQFSEIEDLGGDVYRAYTNPNVDFTTGDTASLSLDVPAGKTFTISFSVLKSANILNNDISGWFRVQNILQQYASNPNLTDDYQTYEFTITMDSSTTKTLRFEFFIQTSDDQPGYIEWNNLNVIQTDIINIVNYSNDNFTPLDYNGTLVSQNQANCYDVSLVSVSLPNRVLLTGGKIAFYQYAYIEFSNATSPTSSTNVIISNNLKSKNALFIATGTQVADPDGQAFITLSGQGTQTIKFKPNDNFRFSVYFWDGTTFQTLIPDTFSPYEPDPSLQVQAIFSFTKKF